MKNYINKSRNDLVEVIFIIILFLFSLNFMNKANYIYVALVSIFIIWMYKKKVKISLTSEFFILTLGFTLYFLIYNINFSVSLQSFITFWIGPIFGYFLGYHIINKKSNLDIIKVSSIIVWGLFSYGMLNMILYFTRGVDGRLVPNIWTGGWTTATLQGTFFTLICSLLFYSIYIVESRFKKVCLIFSILFCIYSTLQIASRTILIIIFITLIVNVMLYVYLNQTKYKRLLNIFLKMLLIISIIIICYNINFLKIKDIYEQSEFYNRVNSEYQTNLQEDPRFEMYRTVIKEMFNYPMGGKKISGINYAHNLWLDIANVVGIIPFFLIVLYSIMTLLTIAKFIKNKYIREKKKYLVISLYSSMTINFMVEPILEGVPYMFIIMCILNGATRKELNEARRSKYYENSMVK